MRNPIGRLHHLHALNFPSLFWDVVHPSVLTCHLYIHFNLFCQMSQDTFSRRVRAVTLLSTIVSVKRAVDAESIIAQHVFKSKLMTNYEAKVRQIAYNLKKTPGLGSLPLETLVLLSDKELAKGTDVERWTLDFELELEKEKKLVNTNIQSTTSLLKCRRCKSDRISTQQVQTRGADEAMTVFCSCDNCNLRWKM
jgi:transcription elongation factor S-II